jgi:hypothetical protein
MKWWPDSRHFGEMLGAIGIAQPANAWISSLSSD